VRILHVNPLFFPYAGGTERRILGISKELIGRGHELHVVTAQLKGTHVAEVFEGVQVHRLPSRIYDVYNPPYISSKGVAEAIARVRPDVIDFHYRWAPSYTRGVRHAFGKVPVVFTYHNTFGEGSGLFGALSRMNDSRFNAFLERCQVTVCVSDFVRRQLIRVGLPEEQLRVVPNGIDLASEEELARLRAATPAEEPPYCVFVGRIVGLKGLDVLIDAAAMTSSPVRFKVVGSGPKLKRLKGRAQRRGVAGRFDFFGYVDDERKRQLIAGAAAMTHPARFEAFGLTLLEALELGCPVIASDTGGIPEIITEGGVLVPPGDAKAMAAAVDGLMGSAPRRAELGQAARERARRYAWPVVAREMEAVYEAAAALKGAGAA